MIKHRFRKIKNCRLCNSENLKLFYKYQDSPLCDEYLKHPNNQFFYPMELHICNSCKFVQLNTVVEPKSIYDNYLYFTNSSISLKEHFFKYSKNIQSTLKLKKPIKVMDIGSNDGMLLSYFKKQGHQVFGIEPYKKAAILANKKNILTFNTYLDVKFKNFFLKKFGKVDLICINNLFANINNLNSFTKICESLLDEKGYIVIESSYLFDMLDNKIFDFVYHEHLSYFSIIPLAKFMKGYGFELFYLTKSKSKGGSMRYIFKKIKNKQKNNLNRSFIENEKKFYTQINIKINKFSYDIKNLKLKFEKLLTTYKSKEIVGFGASATTTTFLTETGIAHQIKFLIDQNPQKIGRYSPGYHLKVKDIKYLKNKKIDLVIILAWRYAKSISPLLQKYKIPFIVPLPTFRLIGKNYL